MSEGPWELVFEVFVEELAQRAVVERVSEVRGEVVVVAGALGIQQLLRVRHRRPLPPTAQRPLPLTDVRVGSGRLLLRRLLRRCRTKRLHIQRLPLPARSVSALSLCSDRAARDADCGWNECKHSLV